MGSILQFIHQDHKNYSYLLSLLQANIDKMQQGERADFICLYDIMNYMTSFPDIHHHPSEEIIFELLEAKAPETRDRVNRIVEEHKTLARLGADLREKLMHVNSGAIVSRSEVLQVAQQYHDLLLTHLNFEEGELLPAVDRVFDDSDWNAVREKIENTEDPLFSETVDEQYRQLLEGISRLKENGG